MFTAERFNTLLPSKINLFITYTNENSKASFSFSFTVHNQNTSQIYSRWGTVKSPGFLVALLHMRQRGNFEPTSPISGRKSRREAKQRGSFRAEIFTIIRTNREPGHSTSPTGKRVSPDPAEIPTGREIRSAHSPRYRYRLSPRRRTRS